MRNPFSDARDRRRPTSAALARPRTLLLFATAMLALAAPAVAEHTRWWRQTTFEDFDKGTAKGVALRSDGKIFLAPACDPGLSWHSSQVLLRERSTANPQNDDEVKA